MVEAADCPEDGVGRTCGRAVVSPETGSAFEDGQRPRAAFFRGPHAPCSPFVVGTSPLVCGRGRGATEAEVVDDEDEEWDAIEEDEFIRCTAVWGINPRLTSSALMEPNPSLSSPEFHRGKCWKLGSGATAVIGISSPLFRLAI